LLYGPRILYDKMHYIVSLHWQMMPTHATLYNAPNILVLTNVYSIHYQVDTCLGVRAFA